MSKECLGLEHCTIRCWRTFLFCLPSFGNAAFSATSYKFVMTLTSPFLKYAFSLKSRKRFRDFMTGKSCVGNCFEILPIWLLNQKRSKQLCGKHRNFRHSDFPIYREDVVHVGKQTIRERRVNWWKISKKMLDSTMDESSELNVKYKVRYFDKNQRKKKACCELTNMLELWKERFACQPISPWNFHVIFWGVSKLQRAEIWCRRLSKATIDNFFREISRFDWISYIILGIDRFHVKIWVPSE